MEVKIKKKRGRMVAFTASGTTGSSTFGIHYFCGMLIVMGFGKP